MSIRRIPEDAGIRRFAGAAPADDLGQGGSAGDALSAPGRCPLEAASAHRTRGGSDGRQALPDALQSLLERKPVAVGARRVVLLALRRERKIEYGCRCRDRAHVTLLHTPTTRPITSASGVRIGSKSSFSGWRRMWSFSLKKRLTVASSPTIATTISPSSAVFCGRTTA